MRESEKQTREELRRDHRSFADRPPSPKRARAAAVLLASLLGACGFSTTVDLGGPDPEGDACIPASGARTLAVSIVDQRLSGESGIELVPRSALRAFTYADGGRCFVERPVTAGPPGQFTVSGLAAEQEVYLYRPELEAYFVTSEDRIDLGMTRVARIAEGPCTSTTASFHTVRVAVRSLIPQASSFDYDLILDSPPVGLHLASLLGPGEPALAPGSSSTGTLSVSRSPSDDMTFKCERPSEQDLSLVGQLVGDPPGTRLAARSTAVRGRRSAAGLELGTVDLVPVAARDLRVQWLGPAFSRHVESMGPDAEIRRSCQVVVEERLDGLAGAGQYLGSFRPFFSDEFEQVTMHFGAPRTGWSTRAYASCGAALPLDGRSLRLSVSFRSASVPVSSPFSASPGIEPATLITPKLPALETSDGQLALSATWRSPEPSAAGLEVWTTAVLVELEPGEVSGLVPGVKVTTRGPQVRFPPGSVKKGLRYFILTYTQQGPPGRPLALGSDDSMAQNASQSFIP